MEVEQTYLSILVAVNTALLLIVAGLAKKQLEWRRPALQPISRRRGDDRRSRPHLGGGLQVLAIVGVCLGGAAAAGVSILDVFTPAMLVTFAVAAALVFAATR